MKRYARAAVCLALSAIVGGMLLVGCSSAAVKATEEEKAQFKGGPMPPQVAEGMKRRMEEAAKRRNQDLQNRFQQGQPGR